MRKVLTLIVIFALFISFVFPIPIVKAGSGKKINVVATLEIFSYFAREVGGSRVNVTYIVPQGEDIHSYSLTYGDMKKLQSADLIILASSQFFSIDKNIREKVKGKNILDFEDYHPVVFPLGNFKRNVHGYWLYPPNALNITRAIEKKLEEMDPTNSAYYESNFLKFEKDLKATLKNVRNMAREANLSNATALLTVPGAFYVVKYLGISVECTILEGPHQFISESELNRIKKDIQDGKINFIVDVQSLQNSRSGQIAIQLSRETGVKIVYIDIFSTSNYTALLLKDASILSSAQYVNSYGNGNCNCDFYLITSLLLAAIVVVLFIIAYDYRKELLK